MNNSKNYAHSDIRFSLCPLKWDFFFEIFSRIWSVYKKKLLYLQPKSHNRDSKSNPLKLFFMYFVKVVKSFENRKDDWRTICSTDLLSLATDVYLNMLSKYSDLVVSGSLDCTRVRVAVTRSQKVIMSSGMIPVTPETQLKLK